MTTTVDEREVIRIEGIRKAFGHVVALKGVSFTIRPGELVGLVGDNGAGKSTLVKIIAGVLSPDQGYITINGDRVFHQSPLLARQSGIETVFQDLALVGPLGVPENLFLGRELYHRGVFRALGIMREREMRERSYEAIQELGIKIPGIRSSTIDHLSGGQRQAVAIARAIFWKSNLLLLDEPTAALGVRESAEVERLIIEGTESRQIGTLIVSHDMSQVSRLCHKVVILRQGTHVATLTGRNIEPTEIVGHVTGARPPQIKPDET